jgi:hypothetical protein
MSSGASFRVIARATGLSEADFDQIGAALSRTFSLDITSKTAAGQVEQIGARAEILDANGQVVGEPGAAGAGTDSATMMGGFAAPPPEGVLELGLDETAPSAASLAADGVPPRPPRSKSFDSLAALDADSLMMLDGSVEEEEAPPAVAMQAAAPQAVADFAPPEEDEVLDLDQSDRSYAGGVSKAAEDGTPVAQPEPPAADAFAPPDAEEELDTAIDTADVAPPPVGTLAPTAEEPPPAEGIPAEAPQAEAEKVKPSRFGQRRRASARPDSPLAVIGWYFSDRPKLRIMIGFVLALGLGAVAPTCYSESIQDKKIYPLLVDLSTAKAHGALMMGSPSYQNPAQIQEQIESIKSRYGFYSFMIWLLMSGAVGVLWFYVTRES